MRPDGEFGKSPHYLWMTTSNPAFAILRSKGLRAHQLESAFLHNTRAIPVPNADPTKVDGHRVVRGGTASVLDAVDARIKESGAIPCGRRRIMAAEFLLGFSDGASPMPTESELVRRSLKFLDDTFGHENVVWAAIHSDERTYHVHGYVVPICEGRPPGRPSIKIPKSRPERPRSGIKKKVSWNQFSGSDQVNYRRKGRATSGQEKRRLPKGSPVRSNAVMAGWQTAWANIWKDYGFRRGIPSKRRHLPMAVVHAEQARISGLAEASLAEVLGGLKLSDADLVAVREAGSTDALRKAISGISSRYVGDCTRLLADLAQRGIQLRSERKARADLADQTELLRGENAALAKKVLATSESPKSKHIGNSQPQSLESEARTGETIALDIPALIANLPDDEFARLSEYRRRVRGVAHRPRLSAPEGHRQPTTQPELDFK